MRSLRDRLIKNLEHVIDLMGQELHYDAYAYLIGMKSALYAMEIGRAHV